MKLIARNAEKRQEPPRASCRNARQARQGGAACLLRSRLCFLKSTRERNRQVRELTYFSGRRDVLCQSFYAHLSPKQITQTFAIFRLCYLSAKVCKPQSHGKIAAYPSPVTPIRQEQYFFPHNPPSPCYNPPRERHHDIILDTIPISISPSPPSNAHDRRQCPSRHHRASKQHLRKTRHPLLLRIYLRYHRNKSNPNPQLCTKKRHDGDPLRLQSARTIARLHGNSNRRRLDLRHDRRRVVFLCKVEDSGCFCSCGIGGIS